jgi:hypothetical protein
MAELPTGPQLCRVTQKLPKGVDTTDPQTWHWDTLEETKPATEQVLDDHGMVSTPRQLRADDSDPATWNWQVLKTKERQDRALGDPNRPRVCIERVCAF